VQPNKTVKLGLGGGEEQAISLSIEIKDSIILDDAFAIKAAKDLNVGVNIFFFKGIGKSIALNLPGHFLEALGDFMGLRGL